MQYYARPPKANQYILDERTQVGSTNHVNYNNYAHPVALPGPVLSAKTGKI